MNYSFLIKILVLVLFYCHTAKGQITIEKKYDRANALLIKGRSNFDKGAYKEAKKIFEEMISLENDTLNNCMLKIPSAYNGLGRVFLKLAKYDEAITMFELHIKETEKCSEDKSDLVMAYNNLATPYLYKNNLEKVIELQKRGMSFLNPNSKDYHFKKVFFLVNMGGVNLKKGDCEAGIKYNLQALEIIPENDNKYRKNLSKVYNNLAIAYRRLGQYQKSIEYYKASLNIRKKIYGEEHFFVAKTLMNIGVVYNDLNKFQKSIENTKYALNIFKGLFGENHPEVARCYGNLGKSLIELKEDDRALSFF